MATRLPTSTRRTLTQGAYEQLRRDIIEGRLSPGTRLRVEHLREDYKVGAGTLREALSLLVADALVVQYDQRGFRVKAISLEDFIDITETRILLETTALRQSIGLGDDEWEGNLASAYLQLTRAQERLEQDVDTKLFSEWELRNAAFHEALLAACPSFWQLHFLKILYQQSERYRRLSLQHKPIARNVHAEHNAIYQACLQRDADTACALLEKHIRYTLKAVSHLVNDFLEEPVQK